MFHTVQDLGGVICCGCDLEFADDKGGNILCGLDTLGRRCSGRYVVFGRTGTDNNWVKGDFEGTKFIDFVLNVMGETEGCVCLQSHMTFAGGARWTWRRAVHLCPWSWRGVMRHLFPHLEADDSRSWRLGPFRVCIHRRGVEMHLVTRSVRLQPETACGQHRSLFSTSLLRDGICAFHISWFSAVSRVEDARTHATDVRCRKCDVHCRSESQPCLDLYSALPWRKGHRRAPLCAACPELWWRGIMSRRYHWWDVPADL